MSSLVRTIQKRIMRKQGYIRQTSKVVEVGGVQKLVFFGRGKGPILSPEGTEVGRNYPRFSDTRIQLSDRYASRRTTPDVSLKQAAADRRNKYAKRQRELKRAAAVGTTFDRAAAHSAKMAMKHSRRALAA